MLIKYSRPEKLSDPFQDWMGCEKTLTGVLAKDKTSLDRSDYDVIFAHGLPAANYEEGAYFLDSCFDFMRRKQSSVESHLCEGLFDFINYHRERLEEDGLLSQCLGEIIRLFQSYTSSFEVIHLTDAELEHYKIETCYREWPKYSRVVEELVEYLVEYELFSSVLDDSMTWLNQEDVHKSGWWIAIADYVMMNWYVIYEDHDESNARKQRLIYRIFNLHDYSSHMRNKALPDAASLNELDFE